jgi:uncharacterized membrane protein
VSAEINPEIIVLRLLHVLSALIWVGSGVFTTFFLFPALKPGSPAFLEVMGGLQRRKLFTFLPLTAVVTMLTGARLLQIMSDGFSPAYFELRSGRVFTLGGLAAILAFVLSMLVSRPAAMKAGALAAQRQAASEQDRARIDATLAQLRKRGSVSTAIAMGLLIAAAAAMAVARYL